MKKQIFLSAALLLFSVAFSFAQDNNPSTTQHNAAPKWVSDKGYWVVKGNVHTPKQNTVYFYTLDNQLVYSEKVEGTRIKIHKRKVCMRLKAALEQAIALWDATKTTKQNEALVAVALKK